MGWNLVDQPGRVEHHLIATLEERVVNLNVVGVGLVALGSAKIFASDFMSTMRSAKNIGSWVVGCGMRGNRRSNDSRRSRPSIMSAGEKPVNSCTVDR